MVKKSQKAKEEYIELIKDELEEVLDQEETEVYELSISKEQLIEYANVVCAKLEGFGEDKWKLAEIIGGTLWEVYKENSPGAGLVAHLVIKFFRKGVRNICAELCED